MTITNSLSSSSSSSMSSSASSYDSSNLIYQTPSSATTGSSSSSFSDSLSSYQNRNQNALQRRAQQLRRWREMEEIEEMEQKDSGGGPHSQKSRTPTKVCFSPTTLFLSACAQRDFQECERLLSLKELQEAGGVDVPNCDGLSALHIACIDDNEPTVRWLLSKNANINSKDNEGWTPLHASANCGNYNIIKILISNPRCDLLALNCDNELACDVCETKECEDLIRSQMDKILNNRSGFRQTKRHISDSGDIDDEDEDDENEEIYKELRQQELKAIERDVNLWIENINSIDIKDEIDRTKDELSGATVIHVCAAKGYNDALDKFLSAFSTRLDLDSFRDCDGYTALHAAAFWKQPETFETLLKYGANPDLLTEKTSDNIISNSVLELCKNDPKFVELIEVNKEKEKIAKESETQRKIFAKRQRETRRSTQGVKKEDLEKALKMMEISQNVSTEPLAIEKEPIKNDSLDEHNDKTISKLVDLEETTTASVTIPEPSSMVDDNEPTVLTIKLPPRPPLPIKVSETISFPETSETNNNNNTTTITTTTNTEPETPPTVTMKISSTTPAEFARRRRIKRRATGIEDDSGHALSPDILADSTNPMETIDAAFDVVLSTPVSQSRSTRLSSRPVSNASSLSSLNSIRSSRDNTEDNNNNNISTASSMNSLASYGEKSTDNLNNNKTNDSPTNSYKNSTTSLNNNNNNSQQESDYLRDHSLSSDEIDYKKLFKQLLRENETLRRRIKELEESEKKREQEFGREKRALSRTISELEEELKAMNDIKADNMRLKDENAALIRVISKLSKN